ncbi:aminoacyl-tRNA hydrolase [Inmirania thermothiophila]|uniref:Peptidyl-tRNA hydrolase n=1 Tax=Inmirania thermothiophila TaxID=1750597 RepID=A0A3N1Y8I4_9GAMM|nr:aminoacyl-tRNA hydrolase [Inmirania thermothiophila]ROR34808.1 peptidyl-tRNA hydrolase [Inmirania thermothiophila]
MSQPLALVVGLGNPGPRYEDTRHNAGAWFVEALARAHGVALREEARFRARVGRGVIAGADLRLAVPTTYMNHSGEAVAALARFFRIPPEAILVAHDDLDLPPGTARLKQGGGHGGHNGLRDIIARLGSPAFRRLRLGIGHPGHRDEVVAYVLRRPPPEERRAIEEAVARALEVFPLVAEGALGRAMSRLHAPPRP